MQTDSRINKLLLDSQQLVGHQEDADDMLVRGIMMDYHTATPGILQSFDLDNQTAVVQPAIRRLLLPEGKLVELPPCVDVPVCFAGGVLTFEVSSGMDVLLVFSERAIDNWHLRGGVQNPSEIRHFDLSDGFAFLGFNSRPKVLPDVHADASELRLRDGSNRISVRKDGTVHIGAAASSSILIPLLNGVVHGQGLEPFTRMTFGALGLTSQSVVVKP